jgi:hypothetical protein
MSLDVYLITEKSHKKKPTSGIFIRDSGETKEITIEQWNAMYPDMEPVKLLQEESEETNKVFHANITHNLNIMASAVGIYLHLWRPEEIAIIYANELIEPLRQGLHNLKMNPALYKTFNPENGWGSYEGFVTFVENYLNACYEYPEAKIEISR